MLEKRVNYKYKKEVDEIGSIETTQAKLESQIPY
jgi:hypothetical protein